MIRAARKQLVAYLSTVDWEVYGFYPDDVTNVPCVVVGRPTIDLDTQLYAYACPVFVIGRRISDMDSQDELDAVTEEVIRALNGPDIVVTHVEPAVRVIAELNYPAYVVTCAIGQLNC